MRRLVSLVLAFLFALAGAFALAGQVGAEAVATEYVVAQPQDPVVPTNAGPDLNPQQEQGPLLREETKKKLWIGAIAVGLFAMVYLRNKRKWTKRRNKARGAAAG